VSGAGPRDRVPWLLRMSTGPGVQVRI
jgi:hypothetical protein